MSRPSWLANKTKPSRANLAHIPLMIDTAINNLPPEDLRHLLRTLLSQSPPSTTDLFTTHARSLLTERLSSGSFTSSVLSHLPSTFSKPVVVRGDEDPLGPVDWDTWRIVNKDDAVLQKVGINAIANVVDALGGEVGTARAA
ncbi:hypothetical protein HDU76_010900, partial [Blyttiomyces sp. JEL0837]